MSVNQTNTVDFISTTSDGKVVLTISDHHSWDETLHLQLLQDKINAYLHFIESGQISDDYPNATGQGLIIETVMKFAPNQETISFLEKAKEIITKTGIGFQWRILTADEKQTFT